jgi:hypothetical protein
MRALDAGVAIADELIGAPGRWDARAARGRGAYALGDDTGATTAYAEATGLVEAFASALAPERATRFLHAPAIAEILSLGGHTVSDR